jgi:hypothetical protein
MKLHSSRFMNTTWKRPESLIQKIEGEDQQEPTLITSFNGSFSNWLVWLNVFTIPLPHSPTHWRTNLRKGRSWLQFQSFVVLPSYRGSKLSPCHFPALILTKIICLVPSRWNLRKHCRQRIGISVASQSAGGILLTDYERKEWERKEEKCVHNILYLWSYTIKSIFQNNPRN